jgi:uncharacterized protein DUF1707
VSHQPLEIQVLEAVAQGVTTSDGLVSTLHAEPAKVDAAVAWAVANQMLLRHHMSEGEYLELTDGGLASVAMRRRLAASVDAGGRIDLSVLSRELGVTYQAMQEGQADELTRSQAHVLVDDAERESAVAELSRHFAEGAFGQEELDRRTGLALQARTRGELHTALASLEADAPAPVPLRVTSARTTVRIDPNARKIVTIFVLAFIGLWLANVLLVNVVR